MENAAGVSGIKCIGDLNRKLQNLVDAERFALDLVLESFTVEVLHGDEALSQELSDIVDGADVGVVECRGGASFTAETIDSRWIAGELWGEKLERDKTA